MCVFVWEGFKSYDGIHLYPPSIRLFLSRELVFLPRAGGYKIQVFCTALLPKEAMRKEEKGGDGILCYLHVEIGLDVWIAFEKGVVKRHDDGTAMLLQRRDGGLDDLDGVV